MSITLNDLLTFIGGIFAVCFGGYITLRNSTGDKKDKEVKEAPVLDPNQQALVENYQELHDINQAQLMSCLSRVNTLMEYLDVIRGERDQSYDVINDLKSVLKETETLIGLQNDELVRLRDQRGT